MLRSVHFRALLLAPLALAPLSAQNSPTVQRVLVRGSANALEVEIQTSGAPVAPNTQAITGPDRIVVDFPGATPSAGLRALKVNSGALRGVRSGLFFNNPPITRIVLDLAEPRAYEISTRQNAVVVRLGAGAKSEQEARVPHVGGARLQTASLAQGSLVPAAHLSSAGETGVNPVLGNSGDATQQSEPKLETLSPAPDTTPAPPKPAVNVSYENGMLRIKADKATLAQVLFEVHLRTQAEIAIPAGAEQEEVAADLGPAPARDVLAALLNGSHYNFIFVGEELSLERVILTRRDPGIL
jgi:hypothetical protein